MNALLRFPFVRSSLRSLLGPRGLGLLGAGKISPDTLRAHTLHAKLRLHLPSSEERSDEPSSEERSDEPSKPESSRAVRERSEPRRGPCANAVSRDEGPARTQ